MAAADLLIPTYRSRARRTVTVGTVVTTEVPGLAESLRRSGVSIDMELRLTHGEGLSATAVLPDAVGMLTLKTLVRTVRTEARDVEDLWRCLEIAAADGVEPATFDADETLRRVRTALWRELGPDGAALDTLVRGRQDAPAARLRTRVRALLTETVGQIRPPT